jgi:hypothetical protein
MSSTRKLVSAAVLFLMGAICQAATVDTTPPSAPDPQTLKQLLDRLQADEARIKELEEKLLHQAPAASAGNTQSATSAGTGQSSVTPAVTTVAATPAPPAVPAAAAQLPSMGDMSGSMDSGMGGHSIEIGSGPTLNIRGYLDFDFGVGTDANPLIFPLGVAPHTGFQVGEFDLMFNSKLSDKLGFMGEVVLGTDPTNVFSVDIERYELTYKASKYFEADFGRYHTSIGYYNTAFHHGTWFQTATGRPFMYFFEDSGGMLPVHSVGVSLTGLVPGTDSLGLHWVAELGNGRASNPLAPEPVQNFYTDKNHKDLNFAAYITPKWINGLQIGGSYYLDRMVPPGLTPVDQRISSAYAVYITPQWEFMNEGVLVSNRVENGGRTFNTPLMYTQVSRKFGPYRPYFRYQYVNSPASDPVNVYTGRYQGPSVGLRWDFADYAAFKLQYNRLYQRDVTPGNGLDAQLAFTF